MTIECRGVAQTYIMFLFPKLFSKFYNSQSPYFVSYPQGVEFDIKIKDKDEFSVKQSNQLNICLTDNIKEFVATIYYTWTNKPGAEFDEVKGWDGILKLDCKVHNMQHWKPIMNIITNPNDLSSRVDLPPGLHFYKKIRRVRRKS